MAHINTVRQVPHLTNPFLSKPLMELAEEENIFVIVGEPGIGKTSAAMWLAEKFPHKLSYLPPIVARPAREGDYESQNYNLGLLDFRQLLERSFQDKHFHDPRFGRPTLIHHSLEPGFFTVERAYHYFTSVSVDIKPASFRAVGSRDLEQAFEQGRIPLLVGPPWLIELAVLFPRVVVFYFVAQDREDLESRIEDRDGWISGHISQRLDVQHFDKPGSDGAQLEDQGIRLREQAFISQILRADSPTRRQLLESGRLLMISNPRNPAKTLHPNTRKNLIGQLNEKFNIK